MPQAGRSLQRYDLLMFERLRRGNLEKIVEEDKPHKFVRAGKRRIYVGDMHINHSDIYQVMKQREKKPQPAKDAGLLTAGRKNEAILLRNSATLGIGKDAREREKTVKAVQRIAGKTIFVRGR